MCLTPRVGNPVVLEVVPVAVEVANTLFCDLPSGGLTPAALTSAQRVTRAGRQAAVHLAAATRVRTVNGDSVLRCLVDSLTR